MKPLTGATSRHRGYTETRRLIRCRRVEHAIVTADACFGRPIALAYSLSVTGERYSADGVECPRVVLVSGTRLGPYEVVAQIGVGGMGEVCRATDTKLKRDVAVKVLPSALASNAKPKSSRR